MDHIEEGREQHRMRTVTYPVEPSGKSSVLSPSRTDSRALIVEVGLDDVNAVERSITSVYTRGDIK
jgi:hypothetical protein